MNERESAQDVKLNIFRLTVLAPVTPRDHEPAEFDGFSILVITSVPENLAFLPHDLAA